MNIDLGQKNQKDSKNNKIFLAAWQLIRNTQYTSESFEF